MVEDTNVAYNQTVDWNVKHQSTLLGCGAQSLTTECVSIIKTNVLAMHNVYLNVVEDTNAACNQDADLNANWQYFSDKILESLKMSIENLI